MSYDLYVFPVPPGADPLTRARETFERTESSPPLPPVAPGWSERMQARAAAVAAADPMLTAETHDAGPTEAHVELGVPEDESGLQILVFADAAYVHLPYWHLDADARAAWEQVRRVLQVLEREPGMRTYDPQLDRVLDLDKDLDAVIAEYERMVVHIRRSIVAEPPPPPRPWWKFWG